MEIISQRSLSRFREVKNIFSHCSRVKGVTRGSTRFRAILDKISLSRSTLCQIPPPMQQPLMSKRGMVISLFHRYIALRTQANRILLKNNTLFHIRKAV